MPELIFLGSAERVEELEPDEDPVHVFPCIHSKGLHDEARAQFYALIMGRFFDEALAMESLHRTLTDEGPTIYQLDRALVERLADLDEDDIGEYVDLWSECQEVESMALEHEELIEFIYLLASLCQAAVNETASGEGAGIYVYADT